jgi:UDP-glucuronate decarboxylase
MQRILVTGGAGFLGSHLCEYLLNNGDEIICLDNLFTCTKRNIRHLRDNHRFEFILHDIRQFKNLKVDKIYNLACPASPVHYQRNPVETINTNVMGAINVLEIARECKARVLQASTSEVYGDPQVHPQPESYWGNVNPIGIRSCYDEGKRVAETLMMDYHRQYGVNIGIVRIFNTYGPNMSEDDGRVVSNFIIQALRNEDITIYGDGTQTRSFCYVSDLINGLVKLMEKKDFIGPVNLGNPFECTILELAEKILKLTKSHSRIVHKPLPADDPTQRKPDIALAEKALGWKPLTGLEDGLTETITYFKTLILNKS